MCIRDRTIPRFTPPVVNMCTLADGVVDTCLLVACSIGKMLERRAAHIKCQPRPATTVSCLAC
eukprot:9329866-Alexandrium_andersonii.AAC.1